MKKNDERHDQLSSRLSAFEKNIANLAQQTQSIEEYLKEFSTRDGIHPVTTCYVQDVECRLRVAIEGLRRTVHDGEERLDRLREDLSQANERTNRTNGSNDGGKRLLEMESNMSKLQEQCRRIEESSDPTRHITAFDNRIKAIKMESEISMWDNFSRYTKTIGEMKQDIETNRRKISQLEHNIGNFGPHIQSISSPKAVEAIDFVRQLVEKDDFHSAKDQLEELFVAFMANPAFDASELSSKYYNRHPYQLKANGSNSQGDSDKRPKDKMDRSSDVSSSTFGIPEPGRKQWQILLPVAQVQRHGEDARAICALYSGKETDEQWVDGLENVIQNFIKEEKKSGRLTCSVFKRLRFDGNDPRVIICNGDHEKVVNLEDQMSTTVEATEYLASDNPKPQTSLGLGLPKKRKRKSVVVEDDDDLEDEIEVKRFRKDSSA